MLLNVSTPKFERALRFADGDVPAPVGSGLSKSAASRQFVALSTERLQEWMARDLSDLDILVIQIDGIHITENLVLIAAIGIDGNGEKHALVLYEGATENSVVVARQQTNKTATILLRRLKSRRFRCSAASPFQQNSGHLPATQRPRLNVATSSPNVTYKLIGYFALRSRLYDKSQVPSQRRPNHREGAGQPALQVAKRRGNLPARRLSHRSNFQLKLLEPP